MHLTCGDYSFPLLSLEAAASLIRSLGFEHIDLGLMGNRTYLRPETIATDIEAWVDRVRRIIDVHELEVEDVFLIPWTDYETLAPNHPDPETRIRSRSLFEATVTFARGVGASGITMLPGLAWPEESVSDSLARAVDELSRRGELGGTMGLEVSVEPHLGSLIQAPDRALELVAASSALQLTVDYAHFIRRGVSQEELTPLLDWARQVHARGASPGRLQSPMHENTVDFESLIAELRARQYAGSIAIEYVWTAWERCNELDIVSETVLLRDRLAAALEGRPWSARGPAI